MGKFGFYHILEGKLFCNPLFLCMARTEKICRENGMRAEKEIFPASPKNHPPHLDKQVYVL